MQLSSWSLTQGHMTQGQIVNHMAVDSLHVMFFIYMVHYNWSLVFNVSLTCSMISDWDYNHPICVQSLQLISRLVSKNLFYTYIL